MFGWLRRRSVPVWSCGLYAVNRDGTVMFGSLSVPARHRHQAVNSAIKSIRRAYPESKGWSGHDATACPTRTFSFK